MALRLLCTLVVRPQDVPLPRNQLLLFYRALHNALVGPDQVWKLSNCMHATKHISLAHFTFNN